MDKRLYTIRINMYLYETLNKIAKDEHRSITGLTSYLIERKINNDFFRFPFLDAYSKKKVKTCAINLTEEDDTKLDDIILEVADAKHITSKTEIITSLLLSSLSELGYL